LVLDASRMLPGAVLARQLLELGARLIKIESSGSGDPMRAAPPLVDGMGTGFREFYRGAESICLDLRDARDAGRLRELTGAADVLVESFRPGKMERWDLAPDRLLQIRPSLVLCRLSGFGMQGSNAARVGHDINVVALTGLLRHLPGSGVPRVQIADITAGLLAATSILAALLARERTGRGSVVDQPLTSGAMPLLAWSLADAAEGGGGITDPRQLLTGGCPAYRLYGCADGLEVAVGALEPKFWSGLLAMLEIRDGEIESAGWDTGASGRRAAERIGRRFATRPRAEWLGEAEERGLPVTAVNELRAASSEPALVDAGSIVNSRCGPFLPSVGRRPEAPAPRLGEHTAAVLKEHGID
jgi:crotonobetainyl-CoA:carnitine CoA-transferase CaiB-like acyl-CoA transferase